MQHKAVPTFTIQHYISQTLLINLNYWSVSKTAETNASRPRPRPRPQNFGLGRSRAQDHGLEDYKTDEGRSGYMLSSVRLSSVTFVRHTHPVEIFGHISMPFGTLAIRWHPGKILRKSSQGNPPSGVGVKRKTGSRI